MEVCQGNTDGEHTYVKSYFDAAKIHCAFNTRGAAGVKKGFTGFSTFEASVLLAMLPISKSTAIYF